MSDIKGANVYLSCENMKCESKHSNNSDFVNLWNEAAHEIFAENGKYFGECQLCGNVRDYRYKVPMRFNGAPDFSTGRVFGSRMEQKSFAKKNGLREV